MAKHVRSTQAWRRLAKQAASEEPLCWLQLPGCTGRSTTGDHVIPVSIRPDLALVRSNVRGACKPCNRKRGNLPIGVVREMYCGATQSRPTELAKTIAAQRITAKALDFFGGDNTATSCRGVAMRTGLANVNGSGAQQLSDAETYCDTTTLGA